MISSESERSDYKMQDGKAKAIGVWTSFGHILPIESPYDVAQHRTSH